MPEHGVRSTYSQCPFQIFLYDDDGLISTATAFFYDFDGENFLVTTWHNVSGKNFLTKSYLNPGQRVPTYLKLKLAMYIGNVRADGPTFTTAAFDVDIYSADRSTALWYEHPVLESQCDVVALVMSRPPGVPSFMHNAANRVSKVKIPIEPGSTVFIIGFPAAISVGFGLPIWKSGYIASEPHYDVMIGGQIAVMGGLQGGQKLPAFFVDSQTRAGLSGSPVFASYSGTWDMTDPYRELNPRERTFWDRHDIALSGKASQFAGVYSGRIADKEEGAALGLCWRESTIEEICRSRHKAKHPHFA